MKNYLLFTFVLACTTLFAADDKFAEAMQKHIQKIYESKDAAGLQRGINGLQRIAQAEKMRWEPRYYITLGYIFMATGEADGAKKDALLDLAKSSLTEAESLKPDDSELLALEGFILMIRLTVDPAARGAQYASMAAAAYEKALAVNGNNPRALSLLAQLQLGTSRFFNQPPTAACATATKALALFDSEKSDSPIAPVWGKSMAEEMMKQCK